MTATNTATLIPSATHTLISTATPTPTTTHTPIPTPFKLVADDGEEGDSFGNSVAYSSDGTTILVGAYSDNIEGSFGQGSAYIFIRSGGIWVQQAKFTASSNSGEYDFFGSSVALSSDGNTALVGVGADDIGANSDQGSVYVYTRSGTTWTQQQKLTASDGAPDDIFGWSVALNSDGTTALISSETNDIGTNQSQGAAYVFTLSGTTWTQQQKLTASDGEADDRFGFGVALNNTGDIALVSAVYQDIGANVSQGSAYVFTRSGTTWTQQQKLIASDGAEDDDFGVSVALNSDGNTALVGAFDDDIGANSGQGSAYIFTRSGTAWMEQQKLIASDGASNDYFARSVALSATGDTALVGAYADTFGANSNQGSAYVFTRSGTTWTQQQKLIASDGAQDDYFGVSLDLSSTGDVALVGAYNADQGAAYIFPLP
ncbi:MAG: FG-GAP repeat protein [Armatimonadetes bacterium]|nr:FG-GAP repeat protein [Anaerolineae bacterium]